MSFMTVMKVMTIMQVMTVVTVMTVMSTINVLNVMTVVIVVALVTVIMVKTNRGRGNASRSEASATHQGRREMAFASLFSANKEAATHQGRRVMAFAFINYRSLGQTKRLSPRPRSSEVPKFRSSEVCEVAVLSI